MGGPPSVDLALVVLVVRLFNDAIVLEGIIIFYSLADLNCFLSLLETFLFDGIVFVVDTRHEGLKIAERIFVKIGG